MQTLPNHPAPFTESVLAQITAYVRDEATRRRRPPRLLDPFAGIGLIHQLAEAELAYTVGIELEPEWALQHPRTFVGSALSLPFPDGAFELAGTSPCYGNRFADSHVANDSCKRCKRAGTVDGKRCPNCRGSGISRRRSYRHDLGRMPSRGSAAILQWGDAYRSFHERAWRETVRVLRPGGVDDPNGGRLILNISDHYRNKQLVPVSDWHVITLGRLGMIPIAWKRVPTPRMKQGQNYDSRAGHENVIVFARAA